MTSPPPSSLRLPRATLVLGGARSGKSRHAEALVATRPPPWIYIATAVASDAEMAERIRRHQARRDNRWQTMEEPLDLVGALGRAAAPEATVLVDCLTLWLSNLMLAERDIAAESTALAEAIGALAGPAVFVSNEVGQGGVPSNPLARQFQDHAGRLHQVVAAVCDQVLFMVAGLPLPVKQPGGI